MTNEIQDKLAGNDIQLKQQKRIINIDKNRINAFLVDDTPYLLVQGDCLRILRDFPDESISCIITSPPYWQQRQYTQNDPNNKSVSLGNEKSHHEYVKNLVRIFSELKRVLKREGSFWLNIGDKYHNKNLMGMPWRVALAMQDDGWILRNDIIWDKMKGTQSAKDRLRDIYEHVFHFVKNEKYYYDHQKIRISPPERAKNVNGTMISATGVSGRKYYEQIKNSDVLNEEEKNNALAALDETIGEMRKGDVVDFRMTIRGCQRTYHSDDNRVSGRAKELELKGYFLLKMRSNGYLPSDIWRIVPEDKWRKDAHYAVFPEELLINPIKATCPINGIVLDPFSGIGSTVLASIKLNRRAIGIELSDYYDGIAEQRIINECQNTSLALPFE